MNTREYVDRLFDNYADTPDLRDFKLEITANLDDRVTDLQKKGMAPDEAFNKAVSELGNITEIADDISKQKRNEVIDKMYVHQKVNIGAKRALAYVIAGVILAFGIVSALVLGFQRDIGGYEGISGVIGAMPFVTVAAMMFTYLGLTQETAASLPMRRKRALSYSLAAGIGAFGIVILLSQLGYLDERGIVAALGTFIPFLIPSAGWLTYLILTEKPRHKPWVNEMKNAWTERYMNEHADAFTGKNAEKFGIASGIIWTLSFALFITFGVIFGFQYSWLVFLFSIVGELGLVYRMMSKK